MCKRKISVLNTISIHAAFEQNFVRNPCYASNTSDF